MAEVRRDLAHLIIPNHGVPEPYSSPRQGRQSPPPERDRSRHAAHLMSDFSAVVSEFKALRSAAHEQNRPSGYSMQVSLAPGSEEVLERLEDRRAGVELLSVRFSELSTSPTLATVFVPERRANHFVSRTADYRDNETATGKPKHQTLVNRIEGAAMASARSVFTDSPQLFPTTRDRTWWEVWLRRGSLRELRASALSYGVEFGEAVLSFRDREVVLMRATVSAADRLVRDAVGVAELRLPKDSPSFFVDLGNEEQSEWSEDLARRVTGGSEAVVAICVLDSGTTPSHPLLRPFLDFAETVRPAWGSTDSDLWKGHGTGMAGLSLFGDLTEPLASMERISVNLRLESVKILAPVARKDDDPELYGAIIAEAIAIAETQSPTVWRVHCLAVTSVSGTSSGRPSSWSAEIDRQCFGEGDAKRLFVAAAGNVDVPIRGGEFLDRNDLSEVQSPAQAWNALTVGAYTEKTTLLDPALAGYWCLAEAGELSPLSRTSVLWDRQWPVKPDIVLEGGNHVFDGTEPALTSSDVALLTTGHDLARSHYNIFLGTSPATALASRMAAQIAHSQPAYWPETVRALMVHSAEWTPSMRQHLGANPTRANQSTKLNLLRRYGYGVPNLDRALFSSSNDLTMIVEDELVAFERRNSAATTKDMHIHRFPWPDALRDLGETSVELRVTLAYFIEPNPGERGWRRRHRYSSHGLRFDAKGSLESDQAFRERINRAARNGADGSVGSETVDADKWFLRGLRNVGSVHSDYWVGTAVDLAQRDAICVYPVKGWWCDAQELSRNRAECRYSLVVSVRVAGVQADIYTPIAHALGIDVGLPITTT